MSFSNKQAICERQDEIKHALETRDSEALYQLADLEKEEGNDEYAEALVQHARRIDREETLYDEANGN